MNNRSLVQFAIALILLIVVAGAYGVFFLFLTNAQKKATEIATEIASIDKADAATVAAQGALEAFAADERLVNSYFLSEADIVSFLEGLELTGESLGTQVDVASVTPGGAKDARLTIALRIEGTFDGVMRTLGAIEEGPHDIRAITVTLDTPLTEEASLWTAAATFSAAIASTSTSTP